MAASAPASRGLTALFKRGWNEIPEVVGSSAMALVGIGLTLVGLSNYYRKDSDNRRYKMDYVVMRPEDPRAAKIRTD
ncbi:AAEL000458-PA [Aedes aegypti]|uniref:AAEL000458-PA n=2 Tax=Aedes aegypti TaxID=7159 RepID=A6KUY5_AEDAE